MDKPPVEQPAAPVPIEEHFQVLEAAVEALESEELSLDEAMRRYETGLLAVRQATAQLDRYRARLEELRVEPAPGG
jgi:exodeoxyribonuclease VII small subunit